MKSKGFTVAFCVVIVAAVAAAAYLISNNAHAKNDALPGKVVTNGAYIDGLYTNFELTDSLQVFRHVFKRLDDEVTVYPSEGYFYFHFTLRGKAMDGAIMLFTPQIDSGIVDFGYTLRVEDKIGQQRVPKWGGWKRFTPKDGLAVEKIDEYTFRLTFEDRSVVFKLFRDNPKPPTKAKFLPDEVPVGPSFDESGLRFYLVYNRTMHWIYWILNEDGFVPEDFTRVQNLVVVGQRTGYAFFVDTANSRKILVGVDGYNVMANNWYDGPFDQMPDRLVYEGKVTVKPYLDSTYRLAPDAIDKYGNFRRVVTSRVPVAPYSVYYKERDLSFVDSCIALGLPASKFYASITRQTYGAPPKDY